MGKGWRCKCKNFGVSGGFFPQIRAHMMYHTEYDTVWYIIQTQDCKWASKDNSNQGTFSDEGVTHNKWKMKYVDSWWEIYQSESIVAGWGFGGGPMMRNIIIGGRNWYRWQQQENAECDGDFRKMAEEEGLRRRHRRGHCHCYCLPINLLPSSPLPAQTNPVNRFCQFNSATISINYGILNVILLFETQNKYTRSKSWMEKENNFYEKEKKTCQKIAPERN